VLNWTNYVFFYFVLSWFGYLHKPVLFMQSHFFHPAIYIGNIGIPDNTLGEVIYSYSYSSSRQHSDQQVLRMSKCTCTYLKCFNRSAT